MWGVGPGGTDTRWCVSGVCFYNARRVQGEQRTAGQPRGVMHSWVREYRGHSVWKQHGLRGYWTNTLRSVCPLMNIPFPSPRSPWICRINVSLGPHRLSLYEALWGIKGKGLQRSKWTWELGLKADKHRNTEGPGKCYVTSATHTTRLLSYCLSDLLGRAENIYGADLVKT